MRYDGNCHFSNDGLYVEGRWFGNQMKYAMAFARGLAAEYDRPIDVLDVNRSATPFALVTATIQPTEMLLAA